MKIKDIKIAIVGCGAVANQAHIPAWKHIKGIALVATCDLQESLARSTASRWRIPHHYTDVSVMLDSEKPDLLDICTPPMSNPKMISQAMDSGCHIIVEKPLAITPADAANISSQYSLHQNQGLKIGVIYNWLFHPQCRKMLRWIEEGKIGEILNVDFRCLQPITEPMIANPAHWCHSLPGGRMGEVMIHPIYLLHRLLGNLRPSKINFSKKSSFPWVNVDELFLLVEGNRGSGTIYISFNSPSAQFPIINVYGTRGQIFFNGHNLNLIFMSPNNSDDLFNRGLHSAVLVKKISASSVSNVFDKLSGRYKSSHELFLRAFIDYLNEKAGPPVSFKEVVETNDELLTVFELIK